MPKTFDNYATELGVLLSAAEAAIQSGARPKMTKARDDLIAFVEVSNDLIPGVIELDDIAGSARRDVVLALLNNSLNTDLGMRTDELAKLVKTFSTQSAKNNSAASDLKLERVRAVTDAAITVVGELKKFKDVVDSGTLDGKALAKVIQDAIDAVAAVQKKLAG